MDRFLKYKISVLSLVAAGCLLPAMVSAQHYVGVRGGFGGGTSRTFPKIEQQMLWGLYNGGVSWKYYSPEKYVGGVEADILFMQQGYKELDEYYSIYDFPGDTTGYYSRKVNSVMVPLFWQPHVYLFRRHMRVFLNLGVTFSYNISQTFETGSKENGVIDSGDYNMTLVRDNRWGYGLCGGGGIGWSFGRVEVLGEFRYYIGYSDLMKNRNKYNQNPLRSPLDGMQGSVGIYYRFGKKGILSPPSRNMERKLEEIEQKRRQRGRSPTDEGDPMQDELEIPATDDTVPSEGEGSIITEPETAPEEIAVAAL